MDPSVIKVPSVITFGPKRNKAKGPPVITVGLKCKKGLSCYDWDNMRHVGHNSPYTVGILTYKADITGHVTKRNEKKKNKNKKNQNLARALGISFSKFTNGYETCF